MSWAAHIIHTDGGLAIQFAEPTTRLDMTPDVAAHLASLLAVEARQRMTGVVRTLEVGFAVQFIEASEIETVEEMLRAPQEWQRAMIERVAPPRLDAANLDELPSWSLAVG